MTLLGDLCNGTDGYVMGISWVYNQLNMMWVRLKMRRFYGKSSIDGD